MSQTIEEIEHAILSLSPLNLDRLKAKINGLILLSSPSQGEDQGDDGLLFYDALSHAISEANGKKHLPYPVFKKNRYFPMYKKKLPDVLKFLGENLPTLKRIERMYLFGIVSNVLVTNLQDIKIPVSIGAACRHLDRVPELMDNAFPGYIQAGLLRMLVQAGLSNGKSSRRASEQH